MKRLWFLSILLTMALVLAACPAPAAPADSGGSGGGDAAASDEASEDGSEEEVTDYEGVVIELLTFTGPQIAEPLQRRAPDFAELTGVQVNVTVVPFSELYQKAMTDLATGTNAFDVYVFAPQWMVDYIEPGYLQDISEWVAADEAIEWDDVAPFFRDFSSTYKGSTG